MNLNYFNYLSACLHTTTNGTWMKLCSLDYRSYRIPWLQLCVVSERRSPLPQFWSCFSAWALVILLVHVKNILYHIFIFTNSETPLVFVLMFTFRRLEMQQCYVTPMLLVTLTMTSICDRGTPRSSLLTNSNLLYSSCSSPNPFSETENK